MGRCFSPARLSSELLERSISTGCDVDHSIRRPSANVCSTGRRPPDRRVTEGPVGGPAYGFQRRSSRRKAERWAVLIASAARPCLRRPSCEPVGGPAAGPRVVPPPCARSPPCSWRRVPDCRCLAERSGRRKRQLPSAAVRGILGCGIRTNASSLKAAT
jgi:hypothetical protein